MGMKKMKGKRGFYLKEGNFYRHFSHDAKTNWQGKSFSGLILPEKGQVIIYSQKEYLIIESEKPLLFAIGKHIQNHFSMNDLINKLFEKGLLNYNMKWSRLDLEELDRHNRENFPLVRLSWM